MESRERFVAVALLTSTELQGVGDALRCILPIDGMPEEFARLLEKIDEQTGGESFGPTAERTPEPRS